MLGLSRTVLISVGLMVAGLLAVAGLGAGSGWGSSSWSAYGTWFTGLATFAAVVVALNQTNSARREADQARLSAVHALERAEARFKDELTAADERLARELDATRRMEQVKTLPPIWDVVGELNLLYPNLVEALNEAPRMPRDQDSADLLMQRIEPWTDCLRRLEMTFSAAMMIVSEPHVQDALSELYADTRSLNDLLLVVTNDAAGSQVNPDWTELDARMASILSSRKTMTALVREHLAGAVPLDYGKFGKVNPLAT